MPFRLSQEMKALCRVLLRAVAETFLQRPGFASLLICFQAKKASLLPFVTSGCQAEGRPLVKMSAF
jgi:hypothetical protein